MRRPWPPGVGSRWFGALVSALCGLVPLLLLLWWLPYALAIPGALLVTLLTLPAVYTSVQFTPWWPTSSGDLERIAEAADLRREQRFCELGCGDARVSSYVARKTGASCVAIDLSPFHLLLARIRLLIWPSPSVKLVLGDLFAAELGEFDVLYVYGVPDRLNGVFTEKIARECKRGARVIAYDHPIEGLDAFEVRRPDTLARPIYIYRIE